MTDTERKALQARIEELEDRNAALLMLVDKDQQELESQQATITELRTFLFNRTHICGGRDCVGIYGEQTGSLHRCDDCSELLALKEQTDDTSR